MKQRFSSLDVKVIAHELHESLLSLRLSNVYDLSSRILLLKFAKPNHKKQLVVDTGFRCHLTEFARTTAAAPSAFVARLRKSLKTRRLTSVSQVGTDRVLEFQFSDGQYRLFLEFFAGGNIILTDVEHKILAIARNVSEGEGQEQQRLGLQYSLDNRQNFHGIPPLTKERIRDALQASVDKAEAPITGKKLKVKPGDALRKSLATSITEMPPVFVDHYLQANNFDTTQKPADILQDDTVLGELLGHLSNARRIVEDITTKTPCKGYIFAKRRPVPPGQETEQGGEKRDNLLYDDFHPFIPHKLANDESVQVLEFDNYNTTVDEFFSSLEGQKLESRLQEREATAQKKLHAARQDQVKRIEGLQEVQTVNARKAAAIEANVERVQEAIDAVNGLVAQGMDWVDIGKLIEREKKRHNAVAEVIRLPLKLSENTITLDLAEEDIEEDEADPFETDDEESEDESPAGQSTAKTLSIDINLELSPWSNAREYYEQRRTAAEKEWKTQAHATKAMQSTEQKIAETLKKGLKQEKALLQPIRKQMWFEKFYWFISSDGYLVIAGKDATQNEMLYKKYLRKGDVYCHADLRGSPSIVIKNNPSTPDAPIPPSTLSQAGSLAVSCSEVWDSKASMGAWWVNADQVSKSAPTGEFLQAGSFMIRGQKNFLPPTQLLIGLGFMFRVSDESKARHVKHRLYDTTEGAADRAMLDEDVETAIEAGTYASSDEDEDDQVEEPERDNPLQGQKEQDSDEDDEVDEMVEQTSELDIRAATADEPEESKDDSDTDDDEPESVAPSDFAAPSTPASSVRPPMKKNQPKRGQRGKAKKMAKKYKDQDDEDRAAVEALIGAAAGKAKVEAEAQAKIERQAESAATIERRRAQHQRQQKETAEHEEIRKVMMEEGIDMLEPDESEQMTSLDALTGIPLAGDELIELIPVCGPWTALTKCKYKIKMQPGQTKKGKAVKEILERLKSESARKGVVDEHARDPEKMWPREVELIKALKPEEVINIVPVGKLRVMLPGGASGGGAKKKGGGKGKRGKGSKK